MKKLWLFYLSLSRAYQIAIGVCVIHGFCLIALCLHHLAVFQRPAKHPIIVRTQVPPKTIATAPKTAPKPSPKPAGPKPAPSKQPVKETPKKETKKPALAPPPAKKAPVKESPKPKETPAAKELPVPKQITQKTLPVEKPLQKQEELSVSEELISFLQTALDLPEYGEVKAKLTFDRFGTLQECTILETKSDRNAAFLKKRLPELVFPCFNDRSLTQEPMVFTITFYNVEMR